MIKQDGDLERAICGVICHCDGIKARDIARELEVSHQTVNHTLYSSPLMKELCWQDQAFRWHGIVRQARPPSGKARLDDRGGKSRSAADGNAKF